MDIRGHTEVLAKGRHDGQLIDDELVLRLKSRTDGRKEKLSSIWKKLWKQ